MSARGISKVYEARHKFLRGMAVILFLAPCDSFVHGQSTSAPPTFEVATIKLSSAATNTSSGISTGSGRLSAKNVTLKRCIVGAYEISPQQITGGPPWLDSTRFDIEAKSEKPTDEDAELNRLLIQLLADRFQLKLHTEQRPTQVYMLEQLPAGLKLKPDETGEAYSNTSSSNSRVVLQVAHTTMDDFAKRLSRSMDHPVVNSTGLAGTYRFELQWTPERAQLSEASGGDSVSIFTAVQEQLGLRLRSAKLPVETYVIDSATAPSDN